MPRDQPVRGDIYHIDFPPPWGPHYAVVVSHDVINTSSKSVVVALITSQHVEEIYPHQFKVPNGILSKPSKVKGDALVMIYRDDIKADNWMGAIQDDKDIQGLDIAIMQALDLWRC